MDHPPALIAPQPPAEPAALPVPAEGKAVPLEAHTGRPGAWWPAIRPDLEQAAVRVVGRAAVDAWAVPPVGDPAVIDAVGTRAVEAAFAVATDTSVDGHHRAAAVTDGRRIVEVLAVVQEQATARRERWWDKVGHAVGVLLGLTLAAKLLQPKEPWR